MRYLGIDFGTKKVGIAVSDERGRFAFPKITIPNDKGLIKEIGTLVEEYSVETVVLGESRDVDGTENLVMNEAKMFASDIEKELKVKIVWEREDFTSETARESSAHGYKTDASAAALILQAYLDTQNDVL